MGHVWEAEQLSLRRRVAFKFVRPERITTRSLDPLAGTDGTSFRVQRGGSYHSEPEDARCSARTSMPATTSGDDVGLRPARDLER